MSFDVTAGINYALVKRHYDTDDYVALPFTAVQDYYVVGTMAVLNDVNVIDPLRGWCLFTHGQPAPPAWLVALGLGGIWGPFMPAFEEKSILFLSDQDCFVRFEGAARVAHFIPANTLMHFNRRCLMFFVTRSTVNGTLRVWIEG